MDVQHPPQSVEIMQVSSDVPLGPAVKILAQNSPGTYPKTRVKYLGTTLILLGIVCVILQVILLVPRSFASNTSGGLWSGVFVIVNGGITLGAYRNPSFSLVITSMVMNILGVPVCAVAVSFCVFATVFVDDPDIAASDQALGNDTVTALNLIIVFLTLTSLVIFIVISVLDCKFFCCPGRFGQVAGIIQMVTAEGRLIAPVAIIDVKNSGASGVSADQTAEECSPPPKYDDVESCTQKEPTSP